MHCLLCNTIGLMNPSLQPRALRYLLAVAQTGSIQAAAREVSISASAIDRQLLRLEQELGVPLFDRAPRGMRPTAAGEVLLALAQRWRADVQRTVSDLKQMQGINQGHLRVAIMDSHANGLMPSFVAVAAAAHPGIVLEVEVVTPDDATKRLHDGDADIAVAFNLPEQRDLHRMGTVALPLGCLAAPHHALAGSERLALKDVAQWPMAVQSRALVIRQYLERRHGWLLAQARPPLVTNSLQLLKSLVVAGSHVALTSELDAAPELLRGQMVFIPLSDRNAQDQSASVAISARRPLPRIARLVADLLAQHLNAYVLQVRQATAQRANGVAGKRARARPSTQTRTSRKA
jgi:DNA-binding transcriptional LysR family regulator